MVRATGTTVLMIVSMALVGVACVRPVLPSVPVVTPAGVRFVVSFPEASSVAVAGSFNQWSTTSHPLARDAAGMWRTVVPLPPGDYTFMYVVDGTRWATPALAEDYVDDGFGAKNGVVIVRPDR